MPDETPDLSEFESQFTDAPTGFKASGLEHHGERIFELLGEACDLIVEDCINLLNHGSPALSQYLLPNGMSVMGSVSADGHTVRIQMQVPADFEPFIIATPRSDSDAPPAPPAP